ncbi:glutathione S-transferase [Pandoraea terrae]|uniref:Glutathione S-transferase n=1 Tax=Pandoraea terrae TaxID=1537710 RepID=A0A5E4TCV7_9BURK|nr:glutathione S-transferase [Pandoraea terrae]VVD85970.1 glutathione S-transferase [Pandoraea terrae]
MAYELFYWPGLQGRGEFVRLAFEATKTPYVDIVREAGPGRGMGEMMSMLRDDSLVEAPFAPPFLRVGDQIIGQTANILQYLGPRLGLAGKDERTQIFTHGLQLTIADLVTEVHDSHHPIASRLYYSAQRNEARKRSADLIDYRVPKFFGYFERVLTNNPSHKGWLVGDALTYADLSLFQVIAGLHFAFPRAMTGFANAYPRCATVHDAVAALPAIAAYLQSPRRVPFNNTGIFRHYKALDRASPF